MAWFKNFLERYAPAKDTIGAAADTIIIDIPPKLYYTELALATGISLIGNAVAKCEFKSYKSFKSVRDKDYYLLNVSPNPNESSSQFWHKVVDKMIRQEEGAMVVENGGHLYCLDSFSTNTQFDLKGHIYGQAILGNYQFPRTFRAQDVYLFRLDNNPVSSLLSSTAVEYDKILSKAASAFQNANAKKYKLHIDNIKAGDEDFAAEFEAVIKKQLETYIKNDNAVYPEFDGYVLTDESSSKTQSADDVIKIRKDMYEMVGQALKIPLSLMSGNITNMNEIVKLFLTFCIDPYADMIGEQLNKRAQYENWSAGNYYVVDTGKINHRDIFDLADNIDKLIACGDMSINDIRAELNQEPIEKPWAYQHWFTKNYEKIEDALKNLMEGGKVSE